MESFGAFKQVGTRLAFDVRETEILEQPTVHSESRNYVGMLLYSVKVKIPYNFFQQWCSSIHCKNN